MQRSLAALACAMSLLSTGLLQAEAIEDNSFLLEEAYNQEAGIVQFIQTFQKDKSGDSFYGLSVEVPAPNQTHQISFSLPYNHIEGTPEAVNGLGDVLLNYRYQLIEGETVALAPRLSLILPTGDDKKDMGSGVLGLQTNWALSAKINPSFVAHFNVGATFLPKVEGATAKKSDLYGNNSGMSIIWLASDTFNLLAEFVTSSMAYDDSGALTVSSSALINPGFRYAVNFESSQLVLGASAPTPILYSKGSASYLAYLSYEPKLW